MAKNVGTLIKEARTEAGLTQEQLVRKVKGLNAADISKAERGEKELTQDQLKLIAKATGVTQSSLINAAKGKSAAKKSSSAKTSSKKTSSKKTSSSGSSSTLTLSSEEKKIIKAYRAADEKAQGTVRMILGVTTGSSSSAGGNILGTILEGIGNAASSSSSSDSGSGILGALADLLKK